MFLFYTCTRVIALHAYSLHSIFDYSSVAENRDWANNTRVVSSNPTRARIITPLVRKAIGNQRINTISPEKFRALSLVSATLEIEHVTQFFRTISSFMIWI